MSAIGVRSRLGRPKFLVVGAMKAGTTSVYEMLLEHPDIGGPRRKELHWFSLAGRSGARAYDLRFLGVAGAVVGEASPSYAEYPTFGPVARRMAAAVPDARLVYCVRDPVDRIVSHYHHEVLQGRERRPIASAVEDLDYLVPSLFGFQLSQLRREFPAAQIALVSADALGDPSTGALVALHEFVGVTPRPGSAGGSGAVRQYVSAEREPVPAAATALTSTPVGRVAKALVPSALKGAVRSKLSSDAHVEAARELIDGIEGWVPPPHVAEALREDRAVLLDAAEGCLVLGVEPARWSALPEPCPQAAVDPEAAR